jgi:ribonucleoside-diphosphate reductase alpha chain
LTSMHFYGWKKGLKTGMYYLRTRRLVYRGPECVEGYEEQAVLPTGAPTGRPTDGGNARGLLTP